MTEGSNSVTVKNNKAAHRFEADVDGGTAFASYELSGNDIVFTHTEVPEQSRGHGVGEMLAQAGLEYARANELTVVPECPFIAAYMESHSGE